MQPAALLHTLSCEPDQHQNITGGVTSPQLAK
jgi:hypothetical protein